MNMTIPPEFESFARQQVAAGAFASAEEVVATALHDYLQRLTTLRALIDEGLASDEGDDGEAFMKDFLAETKALAAQAGGSSRP